MNKEGTLLKKDGDFEAVLALFVEIQERAEARASVIISEGGKKGGKPK